MSVGHVARAVEEAGIPTVTVMVRAFRHVAEAMRLPRTVLTRHPMGRTLGAVGDAEGQREVVEAAFSLLENAPGPPAVLQMKIPFRPREPRGLFMRSLSDRSHRRPGHR